MADENKDKDGNEQASENKEREEALRKLESFVSERIQQGVQAALNERDNVKDVKDVDEVGELISGYVKPETEKLSLAIADTKDHNLFYQQHGNISDEEKAEVESIFNDRMKRGRPEPRSEIYQYLYGKKAMERDKKEREEDTKRKASEASDAGISGLAKIVSERNVDPRDMSLEELEKALEGITF